MSLLICEVDTTSHINHQTCRYKGPNQSSLHRRPDPDHDPSLTSDHNHAIPRPLPPPTQANYLLPLRTTRLATPSSYTCSRRHLPTQMGSTPSVIDHDGGGVWYLPPPPMDLPLSFPNPNPYALQWNRMVGGDRWVTMAGGEWRC